MLEHAAAPSTTRRSPGRVRQGRPTELGSGDPATPATRLRTTSGITVIRMALIHSVPTGSEPAGDCEQRVRPTRSGDAEARPAAAEQRRAVSDTRTKLWKLPDPATRMQAGVPEGRPPDVRCRWCGLALPAAPPRIRPPPPDEPPPPPIRSRPPALLSHHHRRRTSHPPPPIPPRPSAPRRRRPALRQSPPPPPMPHTRAADPATLCPPPPAAHAAATFCRLSPAEPAAPTAAALLSTTTTDRA